MIRTKSNPYYLSTFINSKYGQQQLLRFNKGIGQPDLHLEDIARLQVPAFSDNFQNLIKTYVWAANGVHQKSVSQYNKAEEYLAALLGQESVKMPQANYAIRSISASFKDTGRLDAEYYQPKYDSYFSQITGYKDGYSTVDKEFYRVDKKCQRDQKEYRYIEIGDVSIDTGVASYNVIPTEALPDNAKIITNKGDVIVSTVRPNRGAVAILEEDGLLVSGAFTVLRERTTFKKEVLQVLLRLPLYRDLLLRYNVGTSYPVIKNADVLNMPLPLLDAEIQETVASKVRESLQLRKESRQMLERAKRTVEIAIEESEEAAIKWLEAQNESSGEG